MSETSPANAADAPVQASPGSPIYGLCAIVGFIASNLAIFNPMGRTMGIVLAVLAIALAGVALLETIIPRHRGGKISLFTVLVAVAAIGIAVTRLSGYSVLGNDLPADDHRATPDGTPADVTPGDISPATSATMPS